jgi:hypothetical protein
MAGNWRALADYLRWEMHHHGWSSQREFADAAGVAERTIRDLISGRNRDRIPRKIANVELAVGWPPGTARRIVDEGAAPPGYPTAVEHDPDPPPWPAELAGELEHWHSTAHLPRERRQTVHMEWVGRQILERRERRERYVDDQLDRRRRASG